MLKKVKSLTSNSSSKPGSDGSGPKPASGQAPTPNPVPTAARKAGGAAGPIATTGAGYTDNDTIEPLPSFKDTPAPERQSLFLRKLTLCKNLMDFSQNGADSARNKEIKRLNLLEIMDYINTTKGVFNEQTFDPITSMIGENLFRGLAPNNSAPHAQYDPDEDEPVLEASWPHLQYVYEFLLRFVVSNETDPKVVKKYITQEFLVKLLDLFDSEDPRERDYLKTILHRIYGKFMPYRAFIRKSINSIFYRFIYETERHNGIAELLEILGSIINGFALPLKDEHKSFLLKALLPLHKVHHVSMYHQQLSYCVTQFVEKDPSLSCQVLAHILDYWPRTFSAKEVLFLNEVEEILEMVQQEDFRKIMVPLFDRIGLCVASPHFQVAERALFLWNNEYIVSLIAQSRSDVLPLVFAPLYENSRSHWNSTVHGLTCNVVKLFMEMDSTLFDQCSAQHQETKDKEQAWKKETEERWEKIKALAEKNDSKIAEQVLDTSGHSYLMRDDQGKKALREVDWDSMTSSFDQLSLTPTSEHLKRKSMIPTNKA